MNRYQAYPKYKASGVEWLGDVPEHWSIARNKSFLTLNKAQVGKNSRDFQLLSLTLNGIVTRDIDSGIGKFPENFDTYQIVNCNDLVFCLFDIDETPRTIGISSNEGMITNAYSVYKCKDSSNARFIYYYYLAIDLKKGLKPFYTGLRKTVRTETFDNIKLPLPLIQEQTTIANFLDTKTAKIDTLIAKQQRMIALLGEKRQAVISHAVTKGLNPDAPMKDSGVEWLGDVPEHWEQFRIDWIGTIVRGNTGFKKDELLEKGEYVALQYGKTYKVDEVNEAFMFFVNSEFYKPNQVVHRGDTVLISTSETVEDLGHSCFYNRDDLGLIGGEQILLKPNSELIFEKYLYFYSKIFCAELRKYATGLKVFRFNIDDLKKIFISVPSVKEQEAIVNYIDDKTAKIDTLISKAKSAITLLQERRSALISAAVTGKIDVRELA